MKKVFHFLWSNKVLGEFIEMSAGVPAEVLFSVDGTSDLTDDEFKDGLDHCTKIKNLRKDFELSLDK